ncbi:MAG: ankyrin repeat domain-containing protein, partial [Candidatus Aminicenantes bacterium]|nr:ankyrin repeat domain-containing protein [Candidatus Aminicenantes bacterium]
MKRTFALLIFGYGLLLPAWAGDIFELLRQGDVQAVKALVAKTPDVLAARDKDGMTPLHIAAQAGNRELVDYLVGKGAKIELQNSHHKTPLHLAVMANHGEAAAALLKWGAVVETRDDYQRTALILCARERGQAATGRVLIEAGADVNAVDKFGSDALELAAWRGKRDFVDLLLARGARLPNPGEKWHGLLELAASQGLETLFQRLAGSVSDLKAAVGEGFLHDAAAGGSAKIMGFLLEKNFDPAQADRFGWTPLHYAARDGRLEAACILLEKGAPLNSRTIMGQSPWDVARERRMDDVAALLADRGAETTGTRFPVLEGDYLGQRPPAGNAELFAPGIIASVWGLHSTTVFSPEGSEVYWSPMITFPGEIHSRGGLLMMKRVNNRWTAPDWAPFSGPDHDDDVPFFSSDGKIIYFISRRPLPGETENRRERIWLAERTAGGWSEPRPLDATVNEHHMHWQFSLDREKNLYFAGQAPDSLGMGDIYMARFSGGKYEKPVNLDTPVNTAGTETSPFIAPDGSYLLYSSQYDIWVSFRKKEGGWSEPLKLGPEVNSPSIELCPAITADGKYLFFLSQRDGESHPYWVSAEAVHK